MYGEIFNHLKGKSTPSKVYSATSAYKNSQKLSFMVTCVSLIFIHQMDIFIFSVGHLVRHSNIFCQTFIIKNVRLSDKSDEFRQHWYYRGETILVHHDTIRIMIQSSRYDTYPDMLYTCTCTAEK